MSQIEVNTNNNSVNVTNTINTVDVNQDVSNILVIPQVITEIVEVVTPGPQGPKGDPGDVDLLTGSFVTTSSFYAFTSSYNTGSFTGSFTGNGSGLVGVISASHATFAITSSFAQNFNPSATASYALQALTASYASNVPLTASYAISASQAINSDTSSFQTNIQFAESHIPFFDSDNSMSSSAMRQWLSESITINREFGTGANPEALYVFQPNTESINIITAEADVDNYTQFNLFNRNTGSLASADIVATADNGNEFTNYIDMGINSSTFTGSVGGPNDAYLYSTGNDLTIGNASANKHVRLFTGGGLVDVYQKLVLNPDNLHEMTGSLDIEGALIVTDGITGSLEGTASFAITASYASNVPDTASFAVSASYALSASQATNSETSSFQTNIQFTEGYVPFFNSNSSLSSSVIYQWTTESIVINGEFGTGNSPEALYIFQPNPDSVNVISSVGDVDNYIQTNVFNRNSGSTASADVVATADNGNEYINYIDMGINSSTFTGSVGGPNDAYLYSTGNDLTIGNATANKHIRFFTGGGLVPVYQKLILNPDNLHEMTGSLDIEGSLIVTDGITGSLEGTASYSATASYLNPLTQSVLVSGSVNLTGTGNQIFSVNGSSGVLFEVDDITSGSIYTVYNPLTNIPILDINSNNTVSIIGDLNITGSDYTNSAIRFVSGAVITTSGPNLDMTAGSGGWSEIGSNNNQQYVWVDDDYVRLVTNWSLGAYIWLLDLTGSLTLPISSSRAILNPDGSPWTASFANNSTSASYAATASYFLTGSVTSASYAETSSFASDFTVTGTLTAQTINVQVITSSVDYVTGSTIFGSDLTNTHQFTGSVTITGSLAVNDSNVILTNQTSSMTVLSSSFAISASQAENSNNAVTASYILNAVSASFATTASYALTAKSSSFALTASFIDGGSY